MAAGLLAWGIGETPISRVEPQQSNLLVMGQPTETLASTPEAIKEAESLTAIRSVGTTGAVLGLVLGLVSGLLFRGKQVAIVAGATGAVVGGLLGAVGPVVSGPLYDAIRTPGKDELLPVLLTHLALWAPVGAAGGLAFGLGRSTKPTLLLSSVIAGAVGGAIGGAIFQVIGSIAFPTDGADKLISTTPVSRLASRLIVSGAVGILVAMAQDSSSRAGRSEHAKASS